MPILLARGLVVKEAVKEQPEGWRRPEGVDESQEACRRIAERRPIRNAIQLASAVCGEFTAAVTKERSRA